MPNTLIHSEPDRPEYDEWEGADAEYCECDNGPDEDHEDEASGVCKNCGRLIE
jgi:hypothetical protein